MKLGQHVGIGAVRRLSSLGRAGAKLLPKDAMLLRSCESRCVRVLRSLPRVCAYAEVAVRPRPSSALTRRHSCSKIDHPPRRQQVSSPRAQLETTVILRLSRVATLSRKSFVLPGDVVSARSFSSGARAKSSSAAAAAARGLKDRNRKVAMYMATVVAAVLGVSYAAVPLYKAFCQMTGFGGTTQVADEDKALKMKPVEGGRIIRVTFDGGTADTMPWKFRPTQSDVKVVPGETALAFFTAKNPSSKHITGVATYNVFPLKAGIYFNKIQCFCFEEQRLRAGEEIDMPVFFFLDPEMLDDPTMDNVNNVTLSYTFFQTAEEEARPEEEEEEGDKEGEDEQIM